MDNYSNKWSACGTTQENIFGKIYKVSLLAPLVKLFEECNDLIILCLKDVNVIVLMRVRYAMYRSGPG